MTPPPFIPENPLACRSYLRNFHEIGGQGGENREIIWQGLHRPYFMLIKACYNNLLSHLPSELCESGGDREGDSDPNRDVSLNIFITC
jgi:hypothetical protein